MPNPRRPATESITGEPTAADQVCSARGCRARPVWALRWNNPRLHTPDRRKTWLACADHRESLGQFLRLRGFLKEVEPHPTERP